jgi:predicted RNase H-like HicB family nuclease
METRKYTVLLEPEEYGGYSVHRPALPGRVTQGDDRQKALDNIKETIRGAWRTMDREDGLRAEVVAENLAGNNPPPDVVAEKVGRSCETEIVTICHSPSKQ